MNQPAMSALAAAKLAPPSRIHHPVERAPAGPAGPARHLSGQVNGATANVLAMQEAAGNRATGMLVAGMLAGRESGWRPGLIQRRCAACAASGGKCAKCREEEEQLLQRRAEGAAATPAPAAIPASVQNAVQNGGGQPLAGNVRAFMETRFGQGLGHVRIHTGAGAAQAAADLDAHAFTVGSGIWFGSNQYRLDSGRGLHLLAHELAHTVQQRGQAGGVQTALRVGEVSDPLEVAADRAADAVLTKDMLPGLGSSQPVIRRKAKVSAVPGAPEERLVDLDNGERYRVVREVSWNYNREPYRSDTGPTLGLKADRKNAWLQIDWCRTKGKGDTKGVVKLGADVPGAAQDVLERAGRAIVSGKDPRTALAQVNLTPFLDVVVAQSKRYSVDVKATTTVDVAGGEVKKGGVEATVKTGIGEFGGNLQITAPEGGRGAGVEGGFVFKHTFGGPEKVVCDEHERETWTPQIAYTCYKEVPEHSKTGTRRGKDELATIYLYFKYMEDKFEDKANTPGGARNPQVQDQLKQLLQKGYKVTAILGAASPEGPREPVPNWKVGNDALAELRAAAASKWIERECAAATPSLLQMRKERNCFAADLKPQGKGELFTQDKIVDGKVREVEGRDLAEHAAPEFQKDSAEMGRLTPAERKKLQAASGSPERQTDTIYPLLRRAEISLARETWEPYKELVPAKSEKLNTCLPEVKEAAEESFERLKPIVKQIR
jgi:hypothetical protein